MIMFSYIETDNLEFMSLLITRLSLLTNLAIASLTEAHSIS